MKFAFVLFSALFLVGAIVSSVAAAEADSLSPAVHTGRRRSRRRTSPRRPALPTIYGLLAKAASGRNPEFVILKLAVDQVGFKPLLDDKRKKITAFAPNDAAFLKLAKALGYRGSDKKGAALKILAFLKFASRGKPVELLKKILSYHVVVGAVVTKAEAVKLRTIKTALGETFHVRRNGELVDKAPAVPNPRIIEADIRASNGIVHVIDGVLLPFPVADLIKKFMMTGSGGMRRRRGGMRRRRRAPRRGRRAARRGRRMRRRGRGRGRGRGRRGRKSYGKYGYYH